MNITFGERKLINRKNIENIENIEIIRGGDLNPMDNSKSRVNQMHEDKLQSEYPWKLFPLDTAKTLYKVCEVFIIISNIISFIFLMIYVCILVIILQTCHDVIQAGLYAWHFFFHKIQEFFETLHNFSIDFEIPDIPPVDIPDVHIPGVEIPDFHLDGFGGWPPKKVYVPFTDIYLFTIPGFAGVPPIDFKIPDIPNMDINTPNIPGLVVPDVHFKPLHFFEDTINGIKDADKLAPNTASEVIVSALIEMIKNIPKFLMRLFEIIKSFYK